MAIRCELAEDVAAPPARAFAAIDDLPLTAKWLPPCVQLEKVLPGPNAVGDQLKYTFKQGGKTSVMDGEILARTPGERVYCRYWDRAFEVLVDLRVAAAAGGSRLTHVIEIVPKTFLCKLFSPLIRLGLPKQTKEAMANLKKMLEAPSA